MEGMVPRRRLWRVSMVALLLACCIAGSGAVQAAGGHGSASHSASGAVSWRVLNTVAVGSRPVAVAVDGHTGRAFVAGGNRVSVLDGASGAALRTIPAGVGAHDYGAGPDAVAVDLPTARAFVARFNDNSGSMLDTTTGAGRRSVR